MKIPMSWLKDYVNIDVDIDTFMNKMTMSGSKVEGIEYKGKEITNVVTGKIISIEKHPNADKLSVTKVDIGKNENIQIVTAAKNIFEGAIVAVALDGSILHNGLKIKNTKLRGVSSNGMFCSIEELGYSNEYYPEADKDGIYIFKEEYKLGIDVCSILQIKEDIVEFEITSNRADCYSIIGIAREAAATFNKKFNYPKIELKEKKDDDIKKLISIRIKNTEICNRYIVKIVKNIKITSSPLWLRHRIISAGIKPVNNIVDITNYVMLEMGQPLHAFNINSIDSKKIIVRNALKNEEIITLDGIKRKLDDSMLVISDASKAIAIAGIMGGENSMINEDTSVILIESGNFDGTNIRLTSKKLGLRTEASSKYEKSLDPNMCLDAINRCVNLIEKLNYGEAINDIIDIYPNKRESWKIKFSKNNINSLLGINLSNEDVAKILSRLEIVSDKNIAYIPTFRNDLKYEADIIEEIARLYGYNNIKGKYSIDQINIGKKNIKQKIEDIIKNSMVSLGLNEIITFSFESPKVFDKLNISKESNFRKTIKIINPLGEDFSIMRTISLNGMLNSLSLNYNRRNKEACLFELSKLYLKEKDPLLKLPKEKIVLTIGMYSMDNNKKDFYYLKGLIDEFFKLIGIYNIDYTFSDKYDFMHPGRTANINIKKDIIGFLGEIHPDVQNNYEIGKRVHVAVLDIDAFYKYIIFDKSYIELPKFPEITRDISVVVKDEIEVKEIENIIKTKSKAILEDIQLFDIYRGSQIEKNYKSISYNITFRAKDRTLTDNEINNIISNIIKSLEENLGAKLRI